MGSLERMKSEPSAQHYSLLTHKEGLTFSKGYRETETNPRSDSLASLSLTLEPSYQEDHLGDRVS